MVNLKNKMWYILATVLLMTMTGIVVYSFKKPQITTSYPQTQQLATTNNLICEEEMSTALGARDTCEEKNMYGLTRKGEKQWLEEGMRVEGGEDIHKKAFDKRRIKFRTQDGIVYIKEERLIKQLEDEQPEQQFKIVNENEKYIVAQLFDDKNTVSTTAATLLLDKSKGLLMVNDINTSLFCKESLNSYSVLYSCKVK